MMNNQERIRIVLGYGLDEFNSMVEQAGYTWINRYFGLSDDMVDIVSKSRRFWQWWINEWEIRDGDFLFETSLRFITEPLTGLALQHALEEYVEKHNAMKVSIVPNSLVRQELNQMIRERQQLIQSEIETNKPAKMSKADKLKMQMDEQYKRDQFVTTYLNQILDAVCTVQRVTPEDLRSPDRRERLSFSRHAFFYLANISNKGQHISLTEQGLFLNRGHATVLHSRKTAEDLMCTDKAFRAMIKEVTKLIPGISTPMTKEERKEAIRLLECRIEALNNWLVEHPLNPYRIKIQDDIRSLQTEISQLNTQDVVQF